MEIELEFEESNCGCATPEVELTHEDLSHITEWWSALQHEGEQKAALRRCRHVSEAKAMPAAAVLQRELKAHNKEAVLALSTLLAHVDVNELETKFICRLGAPNSKPAYSEVHFSRLLQSKTLDEIVPRFRRAILLLGRAVQIGSLAECILTWSDAHLPFYNTSRASELATRWRREYFGEAPPGQGA